jgi:hypothetical protein
MTKSFIWKRKFKPKKNQFSNTHVFNLFVMEEKVWVLPPPSLFFFLKEKDGKPNQGF